MSKKGRALEAVAKEVVGIRVLLTRLLFGDGILRRLIRRVSLARLSQFLTRDSRK
jgi:hypothetical protein